MTADSGLYYVCSDGDVLDAIISRHYGDTLGTKLDRVLLANPGLASLGAVLGAGTRVFLPDIDTDAPVETAQLWG